jgi:hypothetical protein
VHAFLLVAFVLLAIEDPASAGRVAAGFVALKVFLARRARLF